MMWLDIKQQRRYHGDSFLSAQIALQGQLSGLLSVWKQSAAYHFSLAN